MQAGSRRWREWSRPAPWCGPGERGVVPTTAPNLGLFLSPGSAGRVETALKFTLDSMTLRSSNAVPEPTTALLFGLGAFVVSGGVRRRATA
jgi:hypothetical protein